MSHAKLASLAQAKVGDVVSFNYLGENDYKPKARVVVFSNVHPGGLVGALDLHDSKRFKNFKSSNATDVKVVAASPNVVRTHDEVVKEFAKAPRDVQRKGLEAVALWSVPNAESVEFVPEADLYVVKNKQGKSRVEIKKRLNGYILDWVNTEGKVLTLDLTTNSEEATVENFVRKLVKHYGVLN